MQVLGDHPSAAFIGASFVGGLCLWHRRCRSVAALASPGQSAALIVASGLIVQGVAVWKLRQAVKLGRSFHLIRPARRKWISPCGFGPLAGVGGGSPRYGPV